MKVAIFCPVFVMSTTLWKVPVESATDEVGVNK